MHHEQDPIVLGEARDVESRGVQELGARALHEREVLRVKNHVLVAFSISMYLIPIEYMSIKNTILVYAFIILLTVRKSKRLEKTIWIRNSLLSIIGWAMSYLLHTFNSILGLSDHLLQSLIVTECLIIVTVLFYYSKRKEISLI